MSELFTEEDFAPKQSVAEKPKLTPPLQVFTETDFGDEAPDPAVTPAPTGDPSISGVISSGLSGVNRAIAKTLGAPSDLLNWAVGRDAFGDTSKRFEELFTKMGLIQPAESPFAERVGQTVGEGAAALVPIAGIGSKLPLIGKGIEAIKGFAAQSPLKFMLGELGTSTAAGTGGATAEVMFPNNPAAEMLGELAGGLSPGLLAFTPTRLALKAIRATATPFTAEGARERAVQRLKEVAPDPTGAEQNIQAFQGLGLTPAQASKDPGLLALEKAVIQSNAQLGLKYEQQAALSNRLMRQTLEDVSDAGAVTSTREVLDGRRQYLQSLLDTRTANAVAIAQKKIELAQPRMDRQQANTRLREELEKAETDAEVQERQIWATVPKQVAVDYGTTRSTFENILASRGVAADPEDVPPFLRELIGDVDEDGVFQPGKLGDAPRVGDLHTLRSRVLRVSREERAKPAPNRQKLGILDDIQEAVLADLGANENPSGEIGEAYRAALDFSRSLNQRFRQGPVGALLGYERRGGAAVAPELTGERTLTRGGQHSDVAAQALINAADTPETRGAIDSFMRNLFVAGAVDRTGKVNPAAAERFLVKHEAVLDRFPELKASLTDAKQAQRIADETEAAATAEARFALRDRKTSRLALFLDAPVGQEIRAVFNSGNPRASMKELVTIVGADKSGEALKGLKAAYVDDLISRVNQSSFDAEGNPFFSGRRMMKLLQDESAVISPLFDDKELHNLRRVAAAGAQLEASLHTQPLDKIIDDNPSMIIGLLARTIGARVGARFGSATSGSSLLTASAGARFVRRMVEKLSADKARGLLIDATTEDPELFRALLADASTPRRREFVQRRLNAWLATTGERAFEDDQPPAE